MSDLSTSPHGPAHAAPVAPLTPQQAGERARAVLAEIERAVVGKPGHCAWSCSAPSPAGTS
ncbi:hypothetical protein ABZX88_16710 [Kitasatospora aureofaciens]